MRAPRYFPPAHEPEPTLPQWQYWLYVAVMVGLAIAVVVFS